MVWDFYDGPRTIGIVPPETRTARMDALKRASDLAKIADRRCPHPLRVYSRKSKRSSLPANVEAIKNVASHCRGNGQIFLMETGQETPITLLRAIEDTPG